MSNAASSSNVSVRIAGPGSRSQRPSRSRTSAGLRYGSCEITTTSSRVTATSVSIVDTPSSIALRKAASVFSGARPRAPRWPCTSNAAASPANARQSASALVQRVHRAAIVGSTYNTAMADLFAVDNPATPLAERLRPKTIDEVIGQRHLLAPGKPLAVAFASGKPHSMILWGPPGSGKTTIARLMADAFNAEFIALSAVLSGVKDIRDAVARAEAILAQSGRHTILFVDEVHRFNKAQQDAFLPFVEQGLVTFIGATTENPSFEVNGALLSRAAVYVLEPLNEADLEQIVAKAQAIDAVPPVERKALDRLVAYADGDARRLL